MHAPCRVHKHHVLLLLPRRVTGGLGDGGGVLLVTLFENRDPEGAGVDFELLHRT